LFFAFALQSIVYCRWLCFGHFPVSSFSISCIS
jgi:hypothetical protein